MSEQMKCSPLPWSVDATEQGAISITGEGRAIAEIWLRGNRAREMADAALIVRAVNSHDALVAALKGLYDDQMDYIRLNHLSGAENNHWMVAARAALAAAGAGDE